MVASPQRRFSQFSQCADGDGAAFWQQDVCPSDGSSGPPPCSVASDCSTCWAVRSRLFPSSCPTIPLSSPPLPLPPRLSSPYTSSEFRRSRSESAWKEAEAEKGEGGGKKEKKKSGSVVGFLHTADPAAIHTAHCLEPYNASCHINSFCPHLLFFSHLLSSFPIIPFLYFILFSMLFVQHFLIFFSSCLVTSLPYQPCYSLSIFFSFVTSSSFHLLVFLSISFLPLILAKNLYDPLILRCHSLAFSPWNPTWA